MDAILVSIPYSPWSRRAKHALEAMGVAHRARLYTPTLSEPRLRWELRRPVGRVTLPVLLGVGAPITDSLDIVRWGAQRSDAPLVAAQELDDVRRFNQIADVLLESGRVRTTHRVLADPTALRESLPPVIGPLGRVGTWIGRDAARRLLRKYGDGAAHEELHRRMVHALRTMERALGDGDTLLSRLTYADLTTAEALAFVRPHERHPLRPAAREAWTEPELAAQFTDLLAWRDSVVERVSELRKSRR